MGGRGTSMKLGKGLGGGAGGGGIPGGTGGASSGVTGGPNGTGAGLTAAGAGSAGGGPMSGYPGAGAGAGAGAPGAGTAAPRLAPNTTFGQDPNYHNYSTFASNQDAYLWHEQNNYDPAKWTALSPEERKSIKDYTDVYYSKINTTLRHELTPDTITQSQIDGAKSGLGKTENAMNVIVFRGANAHWTANLLKSDEKLNQYELSHLDHHAVLRDADYLQTCIGKTLRDRGFMSSAVTEDDAWGADVLYKIYVPKGTHGMYVDPISANSGEREYLFNLDQNFVLHQITTGANGEVTKLVIEAIP